MAARPHFGLDLGEEEAGELLDRMVELIPEENHGDFIENYGHGWGY